MNALEKASPAEALTQLVPAHILRNLQDKQTEKRKQAAAEIEKCVSFVLLLLATRPIPPSIEPIVRYITRTVLPLNKARGNPNTTHFSTPLHHT